MVRIRSLCTLFPYTTLFRSGAEGAPGRASRSGDPWPRTSDPDLRCFSRRRCAEAAQVRVRCAGPWISGPTRSEEHTSELQSQFHIVCRLLLEKKNYHIKLLY